MCSKDSVEKKQYVEVSLKKKHLWLENVIKNS